MPSDEYYRLLGLERNASSEDIKKIYRKLAKRLHPDSLGAEPSPEEIRSAEEHFKRMSEAYEAILSYALKRENSGGNNERESREREKQKAKQEEERSKSQEIPKTYTNSIGMKFTFIPEGEFVMGSESHESEEPTHRVKISKPYYFGTYPVTQKQWRDVMGNSPSSFKGDNLPVEQVSWNEVQDFIKKLNEKEGRNKYRLPTEAEWEYAARAGTVWRYSFGEDESILGDYAWFGLNSGSETHDVGQKKPNPWGLYDMPGNVHEWVQDKWHGNYNGAPTDGSSWESGDDSDRVVPPIPNRTREKWRSFESGDDSDRVVRGGFWCGFASDCRSANRSFFDPDKRSVGIGFRLLRSPFSSQK